MPSARRSLLAAEIVLACLASACVLDDVPADRLTGLPPPCAEGWVESDDGNTCILAADADGGVLARDAGARDAGRAPEDAGARDGGALEPDAGHDAGVDRDGGARDGGERDGGASCFDPSGGTPPDGAVPVRPLLNEWVFTHAPIDGHTNHYYEFVEVLGPPETNLDDHTFVFVNSHSGRNLGTIEAAIRIGRTNRGGYWKSCDGWMDDRDVFLQSSASLFLVRNFAGVVGMDLDPNDDGVFDSQPWVEIVDEVGVEDGDAVTDIFYATPVLTNDGYAEHPIAGGRSIASRRPVGIDTGSETDWRKGAFNGYGLPGVTGAPRASEAWLTPGEPNRVQP